MCFPPNLPRGQHSDETLHAEQTPKPQELQQTSQQNLKAQSRHLTTRRHPPMKTRKETLAALRLQDMLDFPSYLLSTWDRLAALHYWRPFGT